MIVFFKKLLLISCVLVVPFVVAKKTKKIQLLMVPGNAAMFYALNDGNGISHIQGAPRPQGSYYVTNAFILPGGTISKSQTNFLVDKHGNPINLSSDPIGKAYINETMLVTLDFSAPLPPAGTLIEMSHWQFYFKRNCNGEPNNIFATGFGQMGVINFQDPAFIFNLAVDSGLGCNENPHHNNFTAKIYISQAGNSLVKIKFDEEIEYKK